jgi:hypothetical protein
MKLTFLCVRHRRWLSADPPAAMYTWRQCFERGIRLEHQHRDNLAIRQAGYAVETAELLLNAQSGINADDITRFTHSALLLARLLRRQNALELASDVVCSATLRLKQVLAWGIQPEVIRRACEQMAQQTGHPAEPSSPNPPCGVQQMH